MPGIGARVLHSTFLPGVKVPAKASWEAELSELGPLERIFLEREGAQLSCVRVHPPQKVKERRLVILAHPLRKRGKYFFANGARVNHYLDCGYEVVLFDFNGFCESDQIDFHFGLDTAVVIREFVTREYSRIVIHGVSFGAYHCLPGLHLLPHGAQVVLENLPRSEEDYLRDQPLRALLVRFLVAVGVRAFREMSAQETLRQLDRRDLRMLCLICMEDTITPPAETKDLLADLGNSVEVAEFDGANHLEAPLIQPERYASVLERFIG